MRALGDIVVGDFPTRFGSLQVFPGTRDLVPTVPTSPVEESNWFPQSIGQDTGRYDMNGPLPGRYYGSAWLAPNSGFVPSVSASMLAHGEVPAAATLDSGGALAPITLTNPLPSVVYPREIAGQETIPPTCPVAEWVSNHPVLAIGAAVLLYLGIAGGRK